jgi:hypothetical protein
MDTTNHSSMPTKNQTMLQSCSVVPITYYFRMESSSHMSGWFWPIHRQFNIFKKVSTEILDTTNISQHSNEYSDGAT